MKKLLVITWLLLIFSAIGALFWYNEMVYHLPTPIPAGYKPVNTGKPIALNGPFKNDLSKPVFIHFFNPDCPCSRFNIDHFRSLVKQYGSKANFMVVAMTTKSYTAKQIQNKLDLPLPVLFDPKLAASCGVYSTPQAVVLDQQHKLYYRGNYNQSRYCTGEKTSYAKMALTALLNDQPTIVFGQLALRAYGCKTAYCGK